MNEDRKFIEPILTNEFDLLFNGHIHASQTNINTNFYGQLFTSIAPGNIAKEIRADSIEFIPGYSIIDYNSEEDKVTTIYRKYNHAQKKFVLNTDKGKEGIMNFPIPSKQHLTLYKREKEVLTDLVDDKFKELNSHLISYGTDSISPKSIDEIFVLPDIVDRPNYDPDKEEMTYGLDYLIAEDRNFILFGRKEAGKTILLDKLAIDITNNFYNLNKLPVYINFKEIGNREIISFVRQYLLVNNKDAKELLEHNRVIILLDNISFHDRDKHILSRLQQFIDIYPSIKLISTAEQILKNVMPTEFLEYPKFNFVPKFIQEFQGKQIRELIGNWFKNKKGQDFQENLERLIDGFRSFELPRTPLSISIFLWIIETQEFNPINKSNLLERFVEGILEKLRTNELLSSTFDYKNKIRLLSSISEYMLSKENDNYHIPYHEVNKFIFKYLKGFGWEKIYSSIEILNDFLNSTIFTKDSNDCISFRFPCFFEFFLASQMGFRKDFFEHVLEEENYLNFINEINYFTGLNRGEENLLKTIVNRSEKIFEELNIVIEDKKIDEFFETKDSSLPLVLR